jgi:hypothetical protein
MPLAFAASIPTSAGQYLTGIDPRARQLNTVVGGTPILALTGPGPPNPSMISGTDMRGMMPPIWEVRKPQNVSGAHFGGNLPSPP